MWISHATCGWKKYSLVSHGNDFAVSRVQEGQIESSGMIQTLPLLDIGYSTAAKHSHEDSLPYLTDVMPNVFDVLRGNDMPRRGERNVMHSKEEWRNETEWLFACNVHIYKHDLTTRPREAL